MEDTRKVFGIDLGTTYSCVAQVDEYDHAVVLKNFNGLSTTPSVVYFETDSKIVVGDEAKGMLAAEPDRTVAFIKREISNDEAYEKPTKFPAGADPTQISAYILKKIVKDANDAKQDPEPINKVVITCPAYFGTKERLRTKQAGEIAGLEVLAVINEPTAAAIAYGMKIEGDKTVLVYDLGGGTFDVTVIRVNSGMITVVATGGDHHLGGYDWDTELAKYMLAAFNKENGTSYTLDSDAALRNKLMLTAEEKKKSLTGRESVNAIVDHEGRTTRVTITRQEFERMTENQIEETIDKTREVLEAAKAKNVTKIDDVLLVGGSSRMPQIKARVDSEFNCNAKLTDPDECVAKGAAIYALNEAHSQAMDEYADGERDEKPKDIGKTTKARVINVTSKSYGFKIHFDDLGFVVDQLILANTPLDGKCRAEATYYTRHDNQEALGFEVFESDVADERRIPLSAAVLLENYTLNLTKRYPKGEEIKAIVEVDTEGVLHGYAVIGPDELTFELKLKGVHTAEEMVAAKAKAAKIVID